MEVAHPLAGRSFTLEIPGLKPSKQATAFQYPTITLSCFQPVTIKRLFFEPGFASNITSLCNGQEVVSIDRETAASIGMNLALQPEALLQLIFYCEEPKVLSKEVASGFVIGEDGTVWQVLGGNTDVLKRVQYTIV